jgi:tripartite ATP-independent transporter DctM subunit
MSPLTIATLYGGVTLVVLFAGVPIAFALGAVAIAFMVVFMPFSSLGIVAPNVYQEVANITLLTIPLFVLKGAAIGRSRAGADLYNALYVWMNRIPGGLGVANVVACTLFAAMAGSSAATCSAIGSAGIPELRRRGYSPGFAAGLIAAGGTLGILLPPSITMILYAVAAEQSLGRLFLAGLVPGMLLSGMFAVYAVLRYRKEYRDALRAGKQHAILRKDNFTMRDRFSALPRILPFLVLLIGVMGALYGGFASPGETAGLGAVLALVLIAVIYGAWRLSDLRPLLFASVRESTMLIMIVGMSLLYSMVMSHLHISQRGRMDRGTAPFALAVADRDPADGRGARLLPAAGQHHPDDRAHHPAAVARRRLRPRLVRRGHDRRDGNGPDSPAGRAQSVRHQEHRARHPVQRCHLGHASVRRDHVRGGAADLPGPGNCLVAAEGDDGLMTHR